ncbi:septal ring lytic transglycosylase RlpA family protein [Methylocystis heyeri]|nr:septal ring lytic transglycosylase RlpA family protein [Methylocystis heyeri]
MKRVIWSVMAIGLASAPIEAKADVVSQLLDSIFVSSADQAYDYAPAERHGRHRRARSHWNYQPEASDGHGHSFTALASWYGGGSRAYEPNSHTASGERFNKWGLTAAHRTLPLGTRLLLTHGGRSCVVRINDRGPAAWTGRSLDVSKGAAAQLGLIQSGTGRVNVTVLASR